MSRERLPTIMAALADVLPRMAGDVQDRIIWWPVIDSDRIHPTAGELCALRNGSGHARVDRARSRARAIAASRHLRHRSVSRTPAATHLYRSSPSQFQPGRLALFCRIHCRHRQLFHAGSFDVFLSTFGFPPEILPLFRTRLYRF